MNKKSKQVSTTTHYVEVYESEVENVLVRIKNKPNIELLAKAVIMAGEAYMTKNGDKHGKV